MRTGVVIPFYQRNPGILTNALASVFAQRMATDFHVFVVDDASPTPPEADLQTLDSAARRRITILKRPNGGPGAARNTALDALGDDIECVAFLDSDDRWDPMHLARAHAALARGYDVYFTNLLDFDSPIDYFQRRGGLWKAQDVALEGIEHAYGFTGRMTSQILAANYIQLSTVVFRRAAAPSLRFRTEFRRAGEDILFWLDLSRLTNRFCYSTAVEVHYGRGVNVYRSATTGADGAFERLRDETRFRRTVVREFAGDPHDRKQALRALREVRKQFAYELLHRLRRTGSVQLREIRAQWQLDPWSVLSLPSNCTRCAADWLTAQASPSQ